MKKIKREYFVARTKDGKSYACDGHETGMGRTIEHVKSHLNAKKLNHPGSIMTWMGGHYRSYDAVRIVEYSEIKEVVPYPSESSIWPDRD